VAPPAAARDDPECRRQRCYAQLMLCSGSTTRIAPNAWQAAQHIARYYAPSLPPSPVAYTTTAAAASGADSTGNGTSPSASGSMELKVLFLVRPGRPAVRKILNLEEAVERCQGWEFTDPASGRRFHAACGVHEARGDMATNIAGGWVRGLMGRARLVVLRADRHIEVGGLLEVCSSMVGSAGQNPLTSTTAVATKGATWQCLVGSHSRHLTGMSSAPLPGLADPGSLLQL